MNIRINVEKMAGNCSEAKKLIENYKLGVIIILEVPIDAYIQVKEIKKDFSELIIGDVIKQWEVLEEKLRNHGITVAYYNNLICSPTHTHTHTHTRLHRTILARTWFNNIASCY